VIDGALPNMLGKLTFDSGHKPAFPASGIDQIAQ
jgi:hypothetical protein